MRGKTTGENIIVFRTIICFVHYYYLRYLVMLCGYIVIYYYQNLGGKFILFVNVCL